MSIDTKDTFFQGRRKCVRDMQIKTTMRYPSQLEEWLASKRISKCCKDVEKENL